MGKKTSALRGTAKVDAVYIHNAKTAAATLFQNKWRIEILCAMCSGPTRLGQLSRKIPGASKKVLTQNLRQLEASGIVVRRDMSDLVLHIEYDLDRDIKAGVCALLDYLAEWGRHRLNSPAPIRENNRSST